MWKFLLFQLGKNTQKLVIDSTEITNDLYRGLMENKGLALEIRSPFNASLGSLFSDIKITELDCDCTFFKNLDDYGAQLSLQSLTLSGNYTASDLTSFFHLTNWITETLNLNFSSLYFDEFIVEKSQFSSQLQYVKNLHFTVDSGENNDGAFYEFMTKLSQLFPNVENVSCNYKTVRTLSGGPDGMLGPHPQDYKERFDQFIQKLTTLHCKYQLFVSREAQYDFTCFNDHESGLFKDYVNSMDEVFHEYSKIEDDEGYTEFKSSSQLNSNIFLNISVVVHGVELGEEEYQQVLWDAGLDDHDDFLDDDDYVDGDDYDDDYY
uniref:Uncharacterized protein n=1 Tax=Panagrolaimus sp. JU765 TaxID=591449 RepID=A0AC34RKD0_9BILA